MREVIKIATFSRWDQQRLHYLRKLGKRSHSHRAFADYSVYFVCLHARDNSRLSFSRGATFLMQLAPFLLYKSHCGASRALYTYKDTSCTLAAVPCTRVPIKDAARKHRGDLPKDEGWCTVSSKSTSRPSN